MFLTNAKLLTTALILVSGAYALKIKDNAPTKWGIIILPNVDILDSYVPIWSLYFPAAFGFLNVTIITPTSDSVTVQPPLGNPFNSVYSPELVGGATFEDDLDLDALVVPGGSAARDPSLTNVDEYILKVFPKLKHLITICTGALFAARAGVLDGRRATTNKRAWDTVTVHGNNVTWVAPARYIQDGNIWSSSGVTSGLDLMFAFIKEHYGQEVHDLLMLGSEHEPRAWDDDPFTDIIGVPHQP